MSTSSHFTPQAAAYYEALGAELADRVRTLSPTVVLSPALGGIVIGQEVGRALGVRALFAERQDGGATDGVDGHAER